LLLALAGLAFRFPLVNQSVVFVVDGSASFEKAREQAEEFINQALLSKKPDDKAAVVLFGQEARVDQSLVTDLEFNHLESIVDRNYSNPGGGLKLADALMPEDSLRRVVLISDGLENSGDLLKETEFLASKGVRVDVMPIYREDEPEAWVKSMSLPERLYPGERFNVTVNINSNVTTPMLLRIFQDGIVIGELNSQVNPGANSFSCSAMIEESGFHTFEVLAEFNQDSIAENNVAHAFTMVAGSPTILVVEGLPGEAASIAAALDSLHINNRVISPYKFPGNIDELQRYAAVVLCNVPAQSLSTSQMEAINLAVQNMGMGLIMVGGDQSFGPGGYFKTPIEKALPVNMDLRGQKEIPSLGLMLVIDKSGSMSDEAGGYAKIDLAREAAVQATEVLGPMDQIGVLAFDSVAKWVIKMRKVDDLAAIQDDIATLRADGGTSIYPALALAYETLKDVDTKYKHIILLSDGQSATSGDYYYLTRRMEKAGITLSTVAVGDGADTGLLESLAEWGQGRYYYTNQADNIPRIFTKETITALRSYLVEEPFAPVKMAGSELLQGINAVPQLHGYVASSIKNAAQMVLASHRGDPILAGWQYGLGRSLAFTSDAGNRWAANWVGWEGYNRFWGNIISWVLPRAQDSSLQMEAYIEGGKGYIKVESDYLTAAAVLNQARIITPDLKSQQLDLQPVAPGIYAGSFKAQEPGVYLINVVQKRGDDVIGSVSGGAALSYSPEYSNINQDESFLKQVAAIGGGSIILEPGEAFADNLPPLKGSVELWPWLLIFAACLLPLDIAARRLNLQRVDINKVRTYFKGKSDGDLQKSLSPTFSRLQQRKQVVKQQRETLITDDGRGENSSLLSSTNENTKLEAVLHGSAKVNETQSSHLDTARLLKRKRKRK